jgi:hypothetical protein
MVTSASVIAKAVARQQSGQLLRVSIRCLQPEGRHRRRSDRLATPDMVSNHLQRIQFVLHRQIYNFPSPQLRQTKRNIAQNNFDVSNA